MNIIINEYYSLGINWYKTIPTCDKLSVKKKLTKEIFYTDIIYNVNTLKTMLVMWSTKWIYMNTLDTTILHKKW